MSIEEENKLSSVVIRKFTTATTWRLWTEVVAEELLTPKIMPGIPSGIGRCENGSSKTC